MRAILRKIAPGFVTLPCGEREAWAPQELLGRCDCARMVGMRRDRMLRAL